MKRRHARVRAVVLLGVVLAHLTLLAWWTARHRPPPAAPAARVTLRLLPPPARSTTQPPVAEAAAPPARATVTRQAPPLRSPALAPRPVTEPLARPDPAPESITAARAEPPAAPASATPPASTLLDGEATRRAIRASARDPGLAAQAGRTGPAVATPEQRLGSGIAEGARGDCLKGEYFGGGAGLLSLPFLAAAALRDQCRH
ncbi:MAG: hypothetical protein QM722_23660 [Piscinibacter sp.]